MFFPLSILRVRIVRDGKRRRNLFLPVVLMAFAGLAMAVLTAPLMLIAAILKPHAVWKLLKTFGHLTMLFFTTRGLHLEINNDRDNILIYHK